MSKETAERHFSRWSLLLLVTVPIAFFVGYVPVALAGFERCGITRCLGDPGGFASPSAPACIGASAFAGAMMFVAFAVTPWIRPAWLRLTIAGVIGILLALYWIWVTLFAV